MSYQTKAQIQAELEIWYQARAAAATGKTLKISTSAGSREVTYRDLSEINGIIDRLERKLAAMDAGTGAGHAFALANFRDSDQ